MDRVTTPAEWRSGGRGLGGDGADERPDSVRILVQRWSRGGCETCGADRHFERGCVNP